MEGSNGKNGIGAPFPEDGSSDRGDRGDRGDRDSDPRAGLANDAASDDGPIWVTLNSVRTNRKDRSQFVNVSVIPLPASRRNTSHTLVRFEPASVPEPLVAEGQDLDLTEAARDRIDTLEAELRFTKENLQATIEELETGNEGLQATNEELLAMLLRSQGFQLISLLQPIPADGPHETASHAEPTV